MAYETRSTTDPASNDDGTPHVTLPFNSAGMILDPQTRRYTPTRTISDVDGNLAEGVSVDLDDSGVQVNVAGGTIAGEKRSGGWTKYTAPVGATPKVEPTFGTRGAADIRPV